MSDGNLVRSPRRFRTKTEMSCTTEVEGVLRRSRFGVLGPQRVVTPRQGPSREGRHTGTCSRSRRDSSESEEYTFRPRS